MKTRIILFAATLLSASMAFAQFPSNSSSGATTTLATNKGGFKANVALIIPSYASVGTINPYASFYDGSLVRIGNDLWMQSGGTWYKQLNTANLIETDPIFTSLGVYNTGSYANPSWLTSLAWSKITGTPTTLSGYGVTDGWSTTGNAITNTDFIGSTNNFPLRFWVNNAEQLVLGTDFFSTLTHNGNFSIKSLNGGTPLSVQQQFANTYGASFGNSGGLPTSTVAGGIFVQDGANQFVIGAIVNDLHLKAHSNIFNTGNPGGIVIKHTTENVLINSVTDVPSSKFTVESTTQGTIPAPRMTTTEVNNIATPVTGLHAYDNVLNVPKYYNGTAWANYFIGSGIAGGQTAYGGTGSGENLTLHSTSHATKGKIFLGANSAYDGTTFGLGLGTTNPNTFIETISTGTNYRAAIRLTIGTGSGTGVSVFNTNAGYSNPFTTTALFGLATGDVINADFVGGMFPYANTGGIILKGVSNASAIPGVILLGSQGVEGTTNGAIYMRAGVTNGAGGVQALAATSNLLQIANNSSALFTILGSGNTGFGVTAPSAVIHPKAGVAAASGAPLKFNSGTLNTTAESGAVETGTNNNLYYTNSSTVRARVGMWAYIAKTSTYTAGDGDYTIDCTSGTFTVTLPTAVGLGGRVYIIKNSGAGVITVGTTSSQTIDGSTTYSLGSQYKYVQVQSNNANWIVMANN